MVAASKEVVDICGHSMGQVINSYKYFLKKCCLIFTDVCAINAECRPF